MFKSTQGWLEHAPAEFKSINFGGNKVRPKLILLKKISLTHGPFPFQNNFMSNLSHRQNCAEFYPVFQTLLWIAGWFCNQGKEFMLPIGLQRRKNQL